MLTTARPAGYSAASTTDLLDDVPTAKTDGKYRQRLLLSGLFCLLAIGAAGLGFGLLANAWSNMKAIGKEPVPTHFEAAGVDKYGGKHSDMGGKYADMRKGKNDDGDMRKGKNDDGNKKSKGMNKCAAGAFESDVHFATWADRWSNFQPVLFPENEEQLAKLVKKAKMLGCRVAVRGAGHSSGGQVLHKEEDDVIVVHLLKFRTSHPAWADRYIPGQDINAVCPHKARIGAGRSLLELTAMTRPEGALLRSQPAGPIFSIGGLVALSVNGAKTSPESGFFHKHVTAMLVMDDKGNIKEITSEEDLQRWRGSFGLCGIILAVELCLDQDFGWNTTSEINAYNFSSPDGFTALIQDQVNFQTNYKLAQNLMSTVPNQQNQFEVLTLLAYETGIPFAPNTDLGNPALNAANQLQKQILKGVYSFLLSQPQYSQMSLTGGSNGQAVPFDICAWAAQFPLLTTLINGVVSFYCTRQGSVVPCSTDCSSVAQYPLVIATIFSYFYLPAIQNIYGLHPTKDSLWALDPRIRYQETSHYVPMDSQTGVQRIAEWLAGVLQVNGRYLEQGYTQLFTGPPYSYVPTGFYEWRFLNVERSSHFDAVPPGKWAQVDYENLDVVGGASWQRDHARFMAELEQVVFAMGGYNHLGKANSHATNPNWLGTNNFGQRVLLSYQNEDQVQTTYAGSKQELLQEAKDCDKKGLFMRGYAQELLMGKGFETFEHRSLVKQECATGEDWQCISHRCSPDNVCLKSDRASKQSRAGPRIDVPASAP
eukprot:g35379.t1